MHPSPASPTAPARARRLARALLACAVLAASAPSAFAADLHVDLGVDADGLRARALLDDLRVPDARLVDDRFTVAVDRRAGAWSAGIGWRRPAVAGPLGNLVLEAALLAGTRPGGERLDAAVAVGVRGVLGPVALEVHAEHGTRTPFARAELVAAPPPAPVADPRARTGAPSGSVASAARAVGVWRPDRAWTVAVAPHGARTTAGWTAGVDASLRRAGVADDLDLSLRLDAARGAAAGHAALGFTAHHVPRRAPESSATVWLGTAPGGGASLGGEASWSLRDGGASALLAVGWGPAWSDRPRGYALLRATGPAGDGRVHVEVAWDGVAWRAGVGGSRPLGR